MEIRDLTILYLVAGMGCAIVAWRTQRERGPRGAASLAATFLLWPLWAPFVLVQDRRISQPRDGASATRAAAARIEAALAEAIAAAAGTGLARLLPDAQVVRVREEVDRAVARHEELDALLATPAFSPDAARERIATLEREAAPARSLATARLHADNVSRLERIRDRDAHELAELADLAAALRTQLVLARYAGDAASSLDGVGGIVGEVWARVEGLSEAIDAHEAS